MPYIKQKRRDALRKKGHDMEGPGELNYILYRIVLLYLEHRGESYQTYCDIEGVLGHIAKEVYRRRTASYEDKKIAENGDVMI